MPEAIWASFDGPDAMAHALGALRERGHTQVEAFSPFAASEAAQALPVEVPVPIPGAPRWLWPRLRGMPLPWVALVAGALGGAAGYAIQWFTNAWAYPQNAGGRPANAIPAFVFNTFESIVFVGSCAVFLALLLVLRLPRLWDPRESIEGFTRTSDDRFGILVADAEPWLVPEETERLLRDLGAADVRRLGAP